MKKFPNHFKSANNIFLLFQKSILALILLCIVSIGIHAQNAECNLLPPEESTSILKNLWETSVTGCPTLPGCGFYTTPCDAAHEFTDDPEPVLNPEILTINVVFHVIKKTFDYSIDHSVFENCIADVNDIYDGGYSGDMSPTNIQFQLAPIDPNGNNLVNFGLQEYLISEDEYDMILSGSDNQTTQKAFSRYRWPNNYLNVFLIEDSDGGNHASLGAYVRVNEENFAEIEGTQDHFSKTVAHEFGHFLGLQHTFGIAGSDYSCESESDSDDGTSDDDCQILGDFICDTPPHIAQDGDPLCYTNTYTDGLPDVYNNVMCYSGNLRDGFTEGQKKRMRYFLKNNLFLLLSESWSNLQVTSDEFHVNEKIFVDGIIYVKEGGRLSFDGCTVLFTPKSRIYVEEGGVLEITNCSYLSSIYDDNLFDGTNIIWLNATGNADLQYNMDVFWDGIVVFGEGAEPADFSTENNGSLGLVVVEESTIAFANEALVSRSALGCLAYNNDGGIIQVDQSNFYNNYNSIHVSSDRDENYSNRITNSLFTQSLKFIAYYKGLGKDKFIDCSDNYLIDIPINIGDGGFNNGSIYGGAIENYQVIVNNSNDFDMFGNKFISYVNAGVFNQSSYELGGMKVSNSLLSIGDEAEAPNEFEKLSTAIEVYGLNDLASPVTIRNNNFEECKRGITLNANPLSQISDNYFLNNEYGIDDGFHIYIKESFACQIHDNELTTYNDQAGICVDNSFNSALQSPTIDESIIQKNYFTGSFYTCVDVRGANQGLQMACNTFDEIDASTKPSSYFHFDDAEDLTPLSLDPQGNCNAQNNQFYANELNSLENDNSFDRVVMNSDNQNIVFNHGPTLFPSTFSTASTSVNVIANLCQDWPDDNACLPISGIIGGGGNEVTNTNGTGTILTQDIYTIINFVNTQNIAGLRQFLRDKGESWSDKLLIINLVVRKDSLEAEQELAQFNVNTSEDEEFKTLLTAINRGEIQSDGTGKTNRSTILEITQNKQSKYNTMAESALANLEDKSYTRNAPKRNINQVSKQPNFNQLVCFPNPATEQVKISWEQFDHHELDLGASLKIFNLSAQLALQKPLKDCLLNYEGISLDVTALNEGIYFVQIEGMSSVAKLIITK